MSVRAWWGNLSMGRTESIFAGILLAAIIMAVAVVVLRSDARTSSSGEPFSSDKPEIGTFDVRFTGNASKDICTCYEQAFAFGAKYEDIGSDIYRGGYQACESRLGPDGARAWTFGWSNGMAGATGRRSCRGYLAQLRTLENQ